MNKFKEFFQNQRKKILPFQVDQQYIALKHYRYYQQLRKRTDIRSYEPFDRNQCIFIHIPKNGGMAVNDGLFDGRMIGGHSTAAFFKVVFGKQFDEYFKFAIARNPWDRLVSAYEYLKGGGMDYRDREWEQKHIGQYHDFKSFVNNWLNEKNIYKGMHVMPQTEFVCDRSGKVIVNYIGRFEHFEDSFADVCNRLGKPECKLPHTNKSVREKDYRTYYGDEEAMRVAKVYRKDIETFGYTFD